MQLRGRDVLAGVRLADHGDDAELGRWRAYVDAPDEPCASCALRPVCKGGCKVVSGFVDGAHGPRPRVPAWSRYRGRGNSSTDLGDAGAD